MAIIAAAVSMTVVAMVAGAITVWSLGMGIIETRGNTIGWTSRKISFK